MSYPTLEQYNEAFQHPHIVLSDPELKQGTIATTGLGLPLALCGGFALTYTIKTGSHKYAVRCFHKKSNSLENRYSSISQRLKNLKSSYFLDFVFQPNGIRVGGQLFPIVKMAWASGTTLGEFVEQNYKRSSRLLQLGSSLRSLAQFLESQGMAHGDIQPGNVMVDDEGKKLQLIDYDGIFVDELRSLGSAELGHRNFQHPKRSANSWDSSLDRFSFIGLDIALRALSAHPELWSKTQSDDNCILFRANDFADPAQSAILSDLINYSDISVEPKNFAAICKSAFDKLPSLDDFLAKRNVPQIAITITNSSGVVAAQYLSAFPVLNATDYELCLGCVGDKVELIGQIFEVKQANSRQGAPYVFINFGSWRGRIVKITIWSEGLAALTAKPDSSWVGKWISVVGLIEPPFVNKQYNYSHLSISITKGSQMHIVTEQQAKFRLAGSSTRSVVTRATLSNQGILDGIRGGTKSRSTTQSASTTTQSASGTTRVTATAPTTSNQAILQKIRSSQPAPQQPVPVSNRPTPYPSISSNKSKPIPKPSSSNDCFISTAVYGADAPETIALRKWRDRRLLQSGIGRTFVALYYQISPKLIPILNRHPWLRRATRKLLNLLLRCIDSKLSN